MSVFLIQNMLQNLLISLVRLRFQQTISTYLCLVKILYSVVEVFEFGPIYNKGFLTARISANMLLNQDVSGCNVFIRFSCRWNRVLFIWFFLSYYPAAMWTFVRQLKGFGNLFLFQRFFQLFQVFSFPIVLG